MFRNILVPVDFTDANRSVLDVAAELSRPSGGLVRLLHVIQTIPGLAANEERKFYAQLEESATKRLGEFGERLAGHSVRWESRIALGSRLGEILRVATEESVDLIALSSHRVDLPGSSSRNWGTLSHQVALLAPCPVLLVK